MKVIDGKQQPETLAEFTELAKLLYPKTGAVSWMEDMSEKLGADSIVLPTMEQMITIFAKLEHAPYDPDVKVIVPGLQLTEGHEPQTLSEGETKEAILSQILQMLGMPPMNGHRHHDMLVARLQEHTVKVQQELTNTFENIREAAYNFLQHAGSAVYGWILEAFPPQCEHMRQVAMFSVNLGGLLTIQHFLDSNESIDFLLQASEEEWQEFTIPLQDIKSAYEVPGFDQSTWTPQLRAMCRYIISTGILTGSIFDAEEAVELPDMQTLWESIRSLNTEPFNTEDLNTILRAREFMQVDRLLGPLGKRLADTKQTEAVLAVGEHVVEALLPRVSVPFMKKGRPGYKLDRNLYFNCISTATIKQLLDGQFDLEVFEALAQTPIEEILETPNAHNPVHFLFTEISYTAFRVAQFAIEDRPLDEADATEPSAEANDSEV